MAGSLRWFTYQSDDGSEWALFGDESNIESANGSGAPGAPANQNYKPPSNLKVRYAVYGNQSGTRSIRVPILTIAEYNSLDGQNSIIDQIDPASGRLNLIRKRPEVISPTPTIFDTGIDDGD